MILTNPQNRALDKLFNVQFSPHKWQSAYGLQESLRTLRALVNKGLIVEKHDLVNTFAPRVNIKFKIK